MIRTFCVNYCDDIRHEVGNKLSLIGIYGADLITAEIPAVIPKLCVFAQLYSDIDTTFDTEVELRVMIDDEIIATWVSAPDKSAIKPKQFQKMTAQFVLTPFFIEKECTLKIRAMYKEQEFKAASLKIKAPEPTAEPARQAPRAPFE